MNKIILFLYISFSIFSEPIILKNENVNSNLTPYVFTEEETEEFSKEKIFELFQSNQLTKHLDIKTPYDWTTTNYWYFFQIQTNENYSAKNYFYLDSPYIFDIELNCFGKKNFNYKTGTKYKYSERPVPHKYFPIPLDLEKNDLVNCFLYQHTKGGRRIYGFSIVSERFLLDESNKEFIFHGIIYGILIFTFINTIILLFILRKKIYFYYSMYVFFMTILILSNIGDLNRVLDFFGIINHKIGTSSIPLAVLFSVLFTKDFFEVSKLNKIYSYLINICIFIPFPLLLILFLSNNLKLSLHLNNYYALTTLTFGFFIGIVSWKSGYRYARFYVWSFLIIFIGVIMTMVLGQMGVRVPVTNLFLYGSILIEIFLLSLALADKQKIVEEEKDNAIKETISIQIEANENLEKKVIERTAELNEEKNKSDKLLLNILPNQIANELKNSGKVAPREYFASILFTDFHGFTSISEKLSPEELVSELDECFRFFDSLMDRFNLEKLKTIGDSFMCAGGIPIENNTHPFDICKAAIEMRKFISERNKNLSKQNKPIFEIRIGIHVGKIIAGVIGDKKFTYDVWGDTVNIASRMESSSEVGKINISEALNEIVKEKFLITPRGEIYAKNKGELKMFFLEKELN